MLNAFWRVAPSVLFNFLAIFAAVFFFANDFNSRISGAVQARRFFRLLSHKSSLSRKANGIP